MTSNRNPGTTANSCARTICAEFKFFFSHHHDHPGLLDYRTRTTGVQDYRTTGLLAYRTTGILISDYPLDFWPLDEQAGPWALKVSPFLCRHHHHHTATLDSRTLELQLAGWTLGPDCASWLDPRPQTPNVRPGRDLTVNCKSLSKDSYLGVPFPGVALHHHDTAHQPDSGDPP